ncbi:MAG: hypothetical protein F4X82_02530 [Candidatus Spechtbacteria bacterium SB0662_bin_43]|uniref:Small ribosomal subunit protein bS6 n=1 Tax=Candidatus Spechtbacteria bacterium SB0662_bin_43 TaxID=2604897 RepID=A0A845DAD6_9BACT|nr:hypothetical protein [Candidatus Spechtbacteria bacterium SB0662_bin_43]
MPKTKQKTNTTKVKVEQKTYGIYLMAHQSAGETELVGLHKQILDILTSNKSRVLSEPLFQKQKLAFPIHKALYAYNAHILFENTPNALQPIQEAMQTIEQPLIRYMITKEHEQQQAPQETKAPEQKQEPKQETQPSPQKDSAEKKITLNEIDKKIDEIIGNL